jgi:anti-sigma B factor antagonist
MRTSGDVPRQEEVQVVMTFHRFELEPFRCEVAPHREEVLVRPVGDLDLATVPMVEAQLADLSSAGFTRLVLDLRGVRFLDSTGLRMLVSWHGRSTNDGLAFSIIPGPPVVQRVLEIAGVDDRLTYATVDGGRRP